MSDTSGDVFATNTVHPPDLIRAIADVSAGNITFTIQLLAGTLDRQTTHIVILLDTDQSTATGAPETGNLGADYRLELIPGTGQATVTKAIDRCVPIFPVVSCYSTAPAAVLPLTISADSLSATVALSLLGNDDGRMNAQVLSSMALQLSAPGPALLTVDFMPDVITSSWHIE